MGRNPLLPVAACCGPGEGAISFEIWQRVARAKAQEIIRRAVKRHLPVLTVVILQCLRVQRGGRWPKNSKIGNENRHGCKLRWEVFMA